MQRGKQPVRKAVVGGVDQIKPSGVLQIVLIQMDGMLLDHAAPVAALEHPVAVHQRDPGKAVFAGVTAAVAAAHTLFIQSVLHVLGHGVLAEHAHEVGAGPEGFGEHGKVHCLSAGIHGVGVQINVAHIVAQTQYLYHDDRFLLKLCCDGAAFGRATGFP